MALNSRLMAVGSRKTSNGVTQSTDSGRSYLKSTGQPRSNSVLTSTTGPASNRTTGTQRRTVSVLNSTSAASARNVNLPPSATLARSNRKQAEKAVPGPKTTTANKGLKLRTANANPNVPVSSLPVLCIYSDRNELIRKEQFRLPDSPGTRIPSLSSEPPPNIRHLKLRNNENIQQQLKTSPKRSAAASANSSVKSVISDPISANQRPKCSTSSVGVRANQVSHSNGRVELPLATQRLKFPRNSSTANVLATANNRSCPTVVKTVVKPSSTTTTIPSSSAGEKVIRRRNENVSQARKAEMTTSGAAVVAATTTGTATAVGGNASLASRRGEVVRISVAVQTASRTDSKSHRSVVASSVNSKKAHQTKTSHASKLPLRVLVDSSIAAVSTVTALGQSAGVSDSNLAVAGPVETPTGLLAPAPITLDIFHRPEGVDFSQKLEANSDLLVAAATVANVPSPFPRSCPDAHGSEARPTQPSLMPSDPSPCQDIICDKDNYVLFDFPDRFIEDHAIYSRVKDDDDLGDPEEEEEDSRSSISSESHKLDPREMIVQETAMSCADPGYGSEKSPDDEDEDVISNCIVTSPVSPTCPETPTTLTNVSHHESSVREDDILDDFFKFVSNENIFKVVVHKTAQGLGLSVTGGLPAPPAGPEIVAISSSDSGDCDDVRKTPPPAAVTQPPNGSWSGLIRIKKIFPHGAAWQTNRLAVGDVLLAANGVSLTGSTNYEALEVLRCSPKETELLVCRIPVEIADKMGLHLPESSCGNSTDPSSSHGPNWLSPVLPLSALGEFEISMTKVNGSLGFTLRKEDESVLGHYIRSLVKEPAISDGRIKPGDKIISVNNVDMSTMSHAEAVAFLRRCPETVTIRLFRDSAVTPLSPLSPTEPESLSLNRPRPLLRQEAQDLLHDLAVRKHNGSRGGSPAPLSGSPCSPRRRRLTKTPSPDLATVVRDRYGLNASQKETSTVPSNAGSPPMSPLPETETERDGQSSGLDLTDSSSFFRTPSGANSSTHQRVTRPDFLDLSNSLVKKQRFMFTPPTDQPPSSFEVRQSGDGRPAPADPNESEVSEYLTPVRMASNGSSLVHDWSRSSPPGSVEDCNRSVDHDTTMNDDEFVSFNSPSIMERYAPQGLSDHDLGLKFPLNSTLSSHTGKEGLVKWKGVVLTPDDEFAEEAHMGLIQTVELNKGWNSRLGFSVGISPEGQLVISAIYDDSVAAKDGRLEVGDQVLRVNGEKLDGCSKEYVIDILRKTRGPVAITVRKAA